MESKRTQPYHTANPHTIRRIRELRIPKSLSHMDLRILPLGRPKLKTGLNHSLDIQKHYLAELCHTVCNCIISNIQRRSLQPNNHHKASPPPGNSARHTQHAASFTRNVALRQEKKGESYTARDCPLRN